LWEAVKHQARLSPEQAAMIVVLDHAPHGLRATMVPDAGFEPATFGLQNRCSTS
jgi:hypothetical protein